MNHPAPVRRLIRADDARTAKFGAPAPSPSTLWRWEKRGLIPGSFKIGGIKYFDEDELDRAITRQRDAARQPQPEDDAQPESAPNPEDPPA
jgi:predicted DNA-binding transcriptional regulator AlpA